MKTRSPNIACAIQTPSIAPASCAATYQAMLRHGSPPRSASVTTGLKWAPEIGPNVWINAMSAAPVARLFASNARP